MQAKPNTDGVHDADADSATDEGSEGGDVYEQATVVRPAAPDLLEAIREQRGEASSERPKAVSIHPVSGLPDLAELDELDDRWDRESSKGHVTVPADVLAEQATKRYEMPSQEGLPAAPPPLRTHGTHGEEPLVDAK